MAEVAEVLQLSEVLDRRPSQLSGGQRQRVAMGRAIIRHPRAFLMDEPLSNLDAKLRVEMRAEIARLQRELAVTTVYVTHDQTEAMTMGTRVAVLRDGRLQQVDTPQRLYDEPVNLFVATFIGSPAMNLLAATVEPRGRRGRLGAAGRQPPSGARRRRAGRASRAALARRAAGGGRDPARVVQRRQPGAPSERVIEATVDLVESLGAETVVHVVLADPPPADAARSDSWRQVVARGAGAWSGSAPQRAGAR